VTVDFDHLRRRLAESLAERGVFTQPWLREVFEKVPRHAFVPERVWTWRGRRWHPFCRAEDPEAWAELVHHPDDAVVTQVDDGWTAEDGSGLVPTSSISAVKAVLNMLASLGPEPGDRVGEIGTGTGYNTALLCERVGERNVFSKEVDGTLAAQARERLSAGGYSPEVQWGDGEEGFPQKAPYDRLISTASVRRVPNAWLEQVRVRGEIVTPWLPNYQALGLMWLRVREPGVARGWFHGSENFMAVRGQREERPDLSALWRETRDKAETVMETPALELDTHARFALAVTLPGVSVFEQDDGWFVLSGDRASYVWIRGGSAGRFGSRDLLRDVHRALEWWGGVGKPRLWDFGVTVTPDEQTIWLGKERVPVPTYHG